MKHSARRWSQLVALSSVLVLATGIAAAPVRNVLGPLAARQFRAVFHLPSSPATAHVAASSVQKSDAAGAVGLADPLGSTAVATPADYAMASLGSTAGTSSTVVEHGDGSAIRQDTKKDWTSAGSDRRSGRVFSRFSRNGRPGYGGGGGFAGGGGGAGAGGSGGTMFAGREYGNGRSNGAGAAPAGPPSVGDGLFNDHKDGGPGLGRGHGRGRPGLPGSPGAGPRVAANPEPSSLLLLGTGLAAAASIIRRRLRAR